MTAQRVAADTIWGEIDTTGSAIAAALGNRLTETGTVPLTANWAAGDYDITGLEKLNVDTLDVDEVIWLTGMVSCEEIRCNFTTVVIDSFKLNAGSDTLLFFIGGTDYAAPRRP